MDPSSDPPPAGTGEAAVAVATHPDAHGSLHDDDERYNARFGDDLARASAQSKILNLKFLNGTSFVLTAIIVIGVALFGAREEGVFGDDFLWMRYQTLLTPAGYVKLLYPIVFLLQGLFLYASTVHPELRHSPLVGYAQAIPDPKQSVAVHYPAICATSIMTVVSHDHGWMGCALVSSALCLVVLANILKIQTKVLAEMEDVSYGDDDDDDGDAATTDLKANLFGYLALRLSFEVYGGYVLALVAMYFVTFLDGFDAVPVVVQLVVANVCMVGLVGAGVCVLWKIPERKFYGVALALVWYLLGVAIELHEPSQPIYNEFSNRAIFFTQAVAWMSTTVLMTAVGVRAMKTTIKHNLFNFLGRLGIGGGGDADTSVDTEEDEDGIGTGYVQA